MVAIASLHVANIVLIILTLVWNQSYFYHNELDFDPAFPSVPPALPVAFQLLGVIGNANVRARWWWHVPAPRTRSPTPTTLDRIDEAAASSRHPWRSST